MTLSTVGSNISLSALSSFARSGADGSVRLGVENVRRVFTGSDQISTFVAVMAPSAELDIDLTTHDTTGTTAWVAGTAQVETATAAGAITTNGNVSVTITAAGMTGSPKEILVPVIDGDQPADWAAKVRTALAADADVSALFTVSGATTAIVLTRKPVQAITANGTDYPIYPANDATLNIDLDEVSTIGVTPAATSADTTAGVATSGVTLLEQGEDFEGNPLANLATVQGVLMQHESANAAATVAYDIATGGEVGTLVPGEDRLFIRNSGLQSDWIGAATFTQASAAAGKLTVTLLGISA